MKNSRSQQALPQWIFWIAAFPVLMVLFLFNLRRILFTLAILVPSGAKQPEENESRREDLPDILILVPCRNEAGMIPEMACALDRLDYPPQKMRVILVNDGSTDQTASRMHACAAERQGWSVLDLENNVGKANALDASLRSNSFGEIIYVLDADHRPKMDALLKLVKYFKDPRVAGVSGRLIPGNALSSPSAYYSAVEGYVHYMLTMRAKDRLGLAPAILGSNCAYRRDALEKTGFRSGALLEDSEITVAFYLNGDRTRFADDVVAVYQVPETVSEYVRQHKRWGRGFIDVARQYIPKIWSRNGLSLRLRMELTMFSLGYLDRMALLGGTGLTSLSYLKPKRFPFPRAVFFGSLLLPWLQILAVFGEQRLPVSVWARLFYVPVFFMFDIWSALNSLIAVLKKRPEVWAQTRRTLVDHKP